MITRLALMLSAFSAFAAFSHAAEPKKPNIVIRHGDWLLIEAKTGYRSAGNLNWETRRRYPRDNDLPVELYDLRHDLAQKFNLAADHPGPVAALSALLKQIRSQGHSAPRHLSLAKP